MDTLNGIKSQALKKGDTVALLSMSWGGPHTFPHVFDAGKKYLEEALGLQTKEYWSTRASANELELNPKKRAEDLMAAFRDPEVKAIFSSIGGEDSMLLLPYLDFEEIRKCPKIVMGYSDTTTLLTALAAQGMCSFHGPSVMAGFAQAHDMPQYWHAHIKEMLFGTAKSGYEFPAFSEFTDGYLDWSDATHAPGIDTWKHTDGWHWIHGDQKVTGRLLGGCLEVLEFLKGSSYWPPAELWKGSILLLETSEEVPSVSTVRRMLRNYGLQGVLQNLSGLVIGRARDYSEDQKLALEKMVIDVCVREYGCENLVIISNFDVGHTDPQLILPIGTKVTLDPEIKLVTLAEDIFSEPVIF